MYEALRGVDGIYSQPVQTARLCRGSRLGADGPTAGVRRDIRDNWNSLKSRFSPGQMGPYAAPGH